MKVKFTCECVRVASRWIKILDNNMRKKRGFRSNNADARIEATNLFQL